MGSFAPEAPLRFKPWDQLTDEDWTFSVASKLMGQINVVRGWVSETLQAMGRNPSVSAIPAADVAQGLSCGQFREGALSSVAPAAEGLIHHSGAPRAASASAAAR